MSASTTWRVRCVECGDLKWPTLPARPMAYVCALCRGGIAAARRAASRHREAQKVAQKANASQRAQESTEEGT